MPERTIEKIMTATEPADVAQLAVIECLRQIADNGKKTNAVLDGMQAEVRDVRERVIRIEERKLDHVLRELKGDHLKLCDRVDVLEQKEDQRAGAKGALDAMVKYGPVAIAIVTALFVVLVASGRIVL